jgi:uncharacterized protein (TIGR03437 family)
VSFVRLHNQYRTGARALQGEAAHGLHSVGDAGEREILYHNRRRDHASIYGTGLGLVTNQPVTGDWSGWGPLAETTSLHVVTVGGVNAQVSWSGLTPDPEGVYQVNFIGGGATSNTVKLAVQ